jgi:hypothetical protein
MPRLRAPHWKNHGPGQGAGTAEKLAIDKISQPSQSKAKWSGHNYHIRDLPVRKLMLAAEQDTRNQGTNERTMKRSTMPDRDYFHRMLQVVTIVGELVNKDVA